jgi:hypothetical protein
MKIIEKSSKASRKIFEAQSDIHPPTISSSYHNRILSEKKLQRDGNPIYFSIAIGRKFNIIASAAQL